MPVAASTWRQFVGRPALRHGGASPRLTTIFGAPFFVFVGGGGTWIWRARVSPASARPSRCALLLGYNLATTGHLFHPAYDYLRTTETSRCPAFYHANWAIEDPRYIPVNAPILLLWPPQDADHLARLRGPTNAPSGLGLIFDENCAVLRPDPVGMSIFLTSPAYLLAIPLVAATWRRRLVAGAALATLRSRS